MSQSGDDASHDAEDIGAWSVVTDHVDDITAALQVSLHALDSEVNPDKHVSSITRKRLSTRAFERLEKAQAGVEELKQHLATLQTTGKKMQTDLDVNRQEQESQQTSLTKCRHQNAMLHDRIQDLEAVIQEHEQAADDSSNKQMEDEAHRRTLQQTIESLNADIGRLQGRSQAAEHSMAAMRQQHEEAMADMTAKTAEAAAACEELDEAKHRASQAEASSEKALQYVAKLSADNVVLMVKLNKAEARRDALSAEAAELRAAVDSQSGPWFHEVHAAVEASQRESMRHADSLQARLKAQEAQAERERAEARDERDKLSQHLATALGSVKELEASLQTSRRDMKEMRVQLKSQAKQLAATAAARDEAAASARVIGEERSDMKREWSEMFAAHDGLQQRIAALQQKVADTRTEAQEDRSALAQARQQLQVERSVNRKLLQSKADVEYQLMEALSQQPSTEAVGGFTEAGAPASAPAMWPGAPAQGVGSSGADDSAQGPAEWPAGSGPIIGEPDLGPPTYSPRRVQQIRGGRLCESPQIPRLQLQHAQRQSDGSLTMRRDHTPGDTPHAQRAHERGSPAAASAPVSRHGSGRLQTPGTSVRAQMCSRVGGSASGPVSRSSTPHSSSGPCSVGMGRLGRPTSADIGQERDWLGSADRTAAGGTAAPYVPEMRASLQRLDDSHSGRGSPAGSARAPCSGAVTARPEGIQVSGDLRAPPATARASADSVDARLLRGLRAVSTCVRSMDGRGFESGSTVTEAAHDPATVMHAWTESCTERDAREGSNRMSAESAGDAEGRHMYEEQAGFVHEPAAGEVRRHVWRNEEGSPSGCEAVSASSDLTPRLHMHAAGEGRGGVRGSWEPGAQDEVRCRPVRAGSMDGERWVAEVSAMRAAGEAERSPSHRTGDWGGGLGAEEHAVGVHGDVAAAMRHRLALDLDEGGRSDGSKSSPARSVRERREAGQAGASGVSFGQENENQNNGVQGGQTNGVGWFRGTFGEHCLRSSACS
eukprot:jgi/Ulvmu1/6485/UM003_0116.1